ncbi:HTH-type transcriptional regulator BetI [Baekduia alba]|uniref:TetR/AcrR family transcriptional regulator n=1 Tax=Baekduia alba TaxID=2997333 RepID=UPI0023406831|nr:TetR/AcrR family transcriptional regulator [Baekduia alba]WCB92235.1 HTH-type transcriptional regulator BetI [Baekduia alba]
MAPASRSPTRLSAPQRREQLLDVTTAIVSEDGFHAVSIEAIAKRAGITRPIVYEHFGDLPGVLKAVVEREMGRAYAQVSETALTDLTAGSARQLMIESLRAYLQAVRDHPTTWRLVLMAPEGAPPLLRASIERGRARVLATLTRAVRPALAASGAAGADSPDAELTAHLLSAVADEYARLVLTDPERFTPERLLTHAEWAVDRLAP